MNPVTYDILDRRVKQLGNLPRLPTALTALCEALAGRADKINVDRVVETISYDKFLTAQCLQMANSTLCDRQADNDTIHDAVLALGLWRIRDLAFSCTVPTIFPALTQGLSKEVFWRHALGTALLTQSLGQEFRAMNQEQAYLAGLLHDVGVLVNGMLFPDDFRDVLEEAVQEKAPVEEVEQRRLGFTHSESGRFLAEWWGLPLEVAEAIEHHGHPEGQESDNDLTLLVHVADAVCWKLGFGYGYELQGEAAVTLDEIWSRLNKRFPRAAGWSPDAYRSFLLEEKTKARALAAHVLSLSLENPGGSRPPRPAATSVENTVNL